MVIIIGCRGPHTFNPNVILYKGLRVIGVLGLCRALIIITITILTHRQLEI